MAQPILWNYFWQKSLYRE